MSKMEKPCNVKPSTNTMLKGFDECLGDIEISVADLPNVNQIDVCGAIANCPEIKNIKAKAVQAQEQIDSINNEKLVKVREDITRLNEESEKVKEDKKSTDQILSEIASNITMLKGWNTRQDALAKNLQKPTIIDTTYYNFDEWIENVYIPQCGALTNKYTNGSIYINVNNNNGATNATYINTRSPNSTEPCSAKDWEMLRFAQPSDMMVMLGIDPLVVSHPHKHEYVVSLDPNKFQDFIAGLKSLDLSKVEVSLGQVYFEPVIKESMGVQENMNVGKKTTTKDLDVKGNANIKNLEAEDAKIKNFSAPVHFDEKVTVSDNVEASSLNVTDTANLNNSTLKGSTRIERVDGDLYASENLRVGENLNVTGTSTFDGDLNARHANISGSLNMPDATKIKIGGVDLETWLINFGRGHWQPR